MADDELSIFEKANEEKDEASGKPRTTLHRSLAQRKRSVAGSKASSASPEPSFRATAERKKSVFYIDKTESRNPALKLMWSGDLNDAERSFDANKRQDPLAYVRWAECHFLRFWLTGDRTMADEVVKRFLEAEQACITAAEACALQLLPAMEKHRSKQPLMRRASRSLARAIPWTASVGLTSKDNPGELLPSTLEFDADRTHLNDWKRLQGLSALCALLGGATQMMSQSYVRGAMCLRRAWQNSRRATENAESHLDQPNALALVMGTFQIALTTVPPWILTFLRAAGFSGDANMGRERLESIVKTTDPAGETHNYARLVLAANCIMLSAQEYRPDRAIQLKKADEILAEVLQKTPDWILFRWMHSHVLRRLGRPEEAAKIISDLATQIQGQLKRVSFRLTFDLASLQFVQRDWLGCERLLKPLVAEDSQFTTRGLAFAMISACCAMRGNVIESVQWLESLEKILAEDKASGRVDTSWLWKVGTLYHRPHKRVLAYEISYLFGYIKWFDSDVAGTIRVGGKAVAADWLDRTNADLSMMHDEASVSVVYPEFPILKEEAAEELLTVSLMCGMVASMRGELDRAERYFKSVLDNTTTKAAKEGTREDPWHIPFALYELGSMEIRRNAFIAARNYLVRGMKLCKRKDFSFHHMLSFKCAGALRYISEQARPSNISQAEWKTHTDELGQWIGDMSGDVKNHSGLAPTDMVFASVPRGEKFELKRPMKVNDTLSWSWAVETHDIGFSAYFVVGGGNQNEEVESYMRFEAGDFVEGFYTSKEEGTIRLLWDNSHSRFTDKKIHYSLS